MKVSILALMNLALVLCLSACTSDDVDNGANRNDEPNNIKTVGEAQPGDGTIDVRGHYVFGHEVRSLRVCGKDKTYWVIDHTNLLADLHQQLTPETVSYSEIFVFVTGRFGPPPADGFGADYPGALTIENVAYAAFEGFGCDFDWNNFAYRAQGNEPFWMVDVVAGEMRLARPGYDDKTWTGVKENSTGETVIFHAIGGDQSTIQLVIESKPSRDTMSGAYYGLSARLILDGKSFTGHALRGATPVAPKTVD